MQDKNRIWVMDVDLVRYPQLLCEQGIGFDMSKTEKVRKGKVAIEERKS